MYWAAVILCFVAACKKKEAEPESTTAPTAPSVGRSVTVIAGDAAEEHGGGSAVAEAPADATAQKLYGGNGAAPYRDNEGKLWPPGGPIYMGRGPDCTPEIDHCLRDGVWFAVGNMQRGKLYRATPVFEFEDKWWTYRRQEESDFHVAYRTKVVEKASELKVGSPVIWLIEESSGRRKWLDSEDDALTSSRWEAGIIESVGTTEFRVAGWPSAISMDTARVIIQQKKQP
jgi:hypothetical protein